MTVPTTTGMPLRGDRLHRYVVAFCPTCHDEDPGRSLEAVERLSGTLAEEADGRVYLVRGCVRHGLVRTLYDEHAEILRYLETWTAPTKRHTPDTAGNFHPVPLAYRYGLGEMQTQHTCILLEDVIQTCNLCCPTCFAASSPHGAGVVPVERVMASIDQRLARENGRLDVLMLSGGEPTVHPDFEAILERAMERPIVRILVNTNGIEIAQSDRLVAFLEKHRDRVEVYLQFDGFRLETHRHHRGADLRRIKALAIERLSHASVFTTLTMTATKGVNDDEIGDVVRLMLETPFVGGVSVQPTFGSGRALGFDPLDRLTHTGVLARLDSQTDGAVTWRDLTALPCSHPHCCSVGYLLRTDTGEWRSLAGLIGHDRLREHLGLVANRIVDSDLNGQLKTLVRQALLGLLSEQTSLTHPAVTDLFRDVCEACDLGLSTLVRLAGRAVTGRGEGLRDLVGRRIKRITVKPFMDMHTMIEERLLQCCVHVGTESAEQHQCVPFCAAQAWGELSAQKLSLSQPAALDTGVLVPLA